MTNSVAILNNERFLDKRGSFFLSYFRSGLHAIPAPLGHSQGADCGAPASWHACMHDGPVHRPHLPPFGPCTARSCQTMHRARERLLHGMHAWHIEFWMLTSRMLHVHVSRLPSLIKWGFMFHAFVHTFLPHVPPPHAGGWGFSQMASASPLGKSIIGGIHAAQYFRSESWLSFENSPLFARLSVEGPQCCCTRAWV